MKKKTNTSKYLTYTAAIMLGFIFIFPFLYTIYTSFVPSDRVNDFVGLSAFTLENYKTYFTSDAYSVGKWLFNTVVMTGIVVVGSLVINPMAAYALAKVDFKGKKVIFWIVILSMMIPYQMILIPVFVHMAELGWLNTYAALTIPFMYQPLYIFLLRQFFISVPNDLIEAARIDGLTKMGAFWRIIYPLSRPGLTTVAILAFSGTWNSFLIPSTFASSPDKYVLVVGLNSVKDMFFENTPLIMAGVMLTTLPILIFFFIFQKQYIEGISNSGLKG